MLLDIQELLPYTHLKIMLTFKLRKITLNIIKLLSPFLVSGVNLAKELLVLLSKEVDGTLSNSPLLK